MTSLELKQELYNVFRKHRAVMSPAFKDGLNQYYASPDPEAYINRIKYYLEMFDDGKGDARYADFMSDVRQILLKTDGVASGQSNVSKTNVEVVKTKSVSETATVAIEKDKSVHVETQIANTQSLKQEPTKSVSKPEPKPKVNVVSEIKDETIQVSKVKPKREHQHGIVRKTRAGKHDIVDLTPKMIKFTTVNGLMSLFEQHFNEVAKNYLLSSGLLTDVEMQTLVESDSIPVKIYKDHDFVLTRSDLFTILILLGLTHLNVDLKDGTIDDLFDNNTVKSEFYQQLANSNLVELDVQSRVRQLQQKMDKSVGQNERIEAMLGLLLLERANVPKNQNRERVKDALETSSVMNQALESFSVLDGVIGSKLASIKDYKRARGE